MNRKHKKLLGKSIDDYPATVDAREEMGHYTVCIIIHLDLRDKRRTT